ncbi:MAG: hypothetical protein JW940_13805, partial [Polyangiaceae bacterium]|nr:hypothetical protein [Polyangiaceae bacterium]
LLREVREAGELLQRELTMFRRTLMSVTGRSDKDYQKLRATKAQLPDEDDDPNAPPAPRLVQPAALDATGPVTTPA